MSTTDFSLPSGDYAWELATLWPVQGGWSEYDYLDLTDETNGRVELTNGRLEFLPMPTEIHQAIVGFLYHALLLFVTSRQLGIVPFPPLRVRLARGKIRMPDVLFLHTNHLHHRSSALWTGADLVMEVVSHDRKDRQRDYDAKLIDYAEGKVAEYWIVDPERRSVEVHRLDGSAYALAGSYSPGQRAESMLLAGFAVDVAELFAVIKDIPE